MSTAQQTHATTGNDATENRSNYHRHRITKLRWRKYTPSGVKRGAAFYIKLAYGLFGIFFLLFAAITSIGEPDYAPAASLPPTAWYFRWLDLTPAASASGADEGDIDELSPFTGEEPALADSEDSGNFSERSVAAWGSDRRHQNLRALLGQGAFRYLVNGTLAGILAALLGLLGAVMSEWAVRPQLPLPHQPGKWRLLFSHAGGSLFHLADHIPKLLLLLIIYGGLGKLSGETFMWAMAIFLSFGPANLFRERLRSYLGSEQYVYAVEMGLSPMRILFRHFIRRQVLPLLKVQMPFLLSLYVMYEATLDFFNLSSGSLDGWGKLISKNHPMIAWDRIVDGTSTLANEMQDSWAFLVPLASLLLVVSSLYVLGDTLREGGISEDA